MKNIAKPNQDKLADLFTILPFTKKSSHTSKEDNATKYVFELDDHNYIESVVIQEKDYKTLCVSSQCGCPVDCNFCLTGKIGFKKNLSKAEIVAQVLYVQHDGHPISRVVFMGMGEPLLNYKPVIAAINDITDPKKFNISKRKITVSTSGYIQGIKMLMDDDISLNLAFSVGSPNPIKRATFMPIETRNPIIEVARLLKSYITDHHRQLTLEYTLLKGVNDSTQEAKELSNLAQYLNAHVNLINLNPHPKIPYEPVNSKTLHYFRSIIQDSNATASIRYSKGQEVTAACGQLGESYLPKI